MSLNFGRAKGDAEVLIDRELCTDCGACAEICKGGPLEHEDGRIVVSKGVMFGCIGCGGCVAVCPKGAIKISGRDLLPEDVIPLAPRSSRSDYASLMQLYLSRRSTRIFHEREVEPEVVQQILDAASTAPMGLPPSNVGVLVFNGSKAVKSVQQNMILELPMMLKFINPFTVALMRPFISKDMYSMYLDFLIPATNAFVEKSKQGEDWFLYDAPQAFYFYGDENCDPGDPIVAATIAMFAAESLGLGTCMLGFPPYLFSYSARLRKKYQVPAKIQPGIMLICGYRKYVPRKAIRRRFGRVEMFQD